MQTLDYPRCHRPMTKPAPNSDLFKRADSLESLFGHLEKTTENLDHVIGDGQQQFEELKQRVERLEKIVQKKPTAPTDNRDQADESQPSEDAA